MRRRMDPKIYDEAEFDLAMQWADSVFKFAEDNIVFQQEDAAIEGGIRAEVVVPAGGKMQMCIRDRSPSGGCLPSLCSGWSRLFWKRAFPPI